MFDLDEFNKYRENNRLEAKKAKDKLPDSLWETYSSFANSYGGVIIIGASENRDGSLRPTGIENPDKMIKDFWNIINNKNKVNINLLVDNNVELVELDGQDIIVISVPKADRSQKPVYINNDMFSGAFRRNHEGDYHCTQAEVLGMLRDQPEETVDMKVIDELTLNDLDKETIRSYRNRHMAYKPGHPWEKLDNHEYLERIGAAAISKNDSKRHPTIAGLLMFGQEYQIVRILPEYFLDYREILDPEIRWTDRVQSSSGDWTGNVFEFYFRVYNKLIKDIKVPFKFEDGARVDDTSIHKAIREVLANCIVNTDYYGVRGIVIKKETDCIVIENPGDIRTGIDQMIKGGESDPRNKALMKMFNLINIGERAGSGIPDVYLTWDKEGLKAPVIEEHFAPNRTVIKLPLVKNFIGKSQAEKATKKSDEKKRRKKVTKKTQDQYETLISFMQDGYEYPLSDLSEVLGVKETRTKQIIKELIEKNLIISIGATKGKKYKKV